MYTSYNYVMFLSFVDVMDKDTFGNTLNEGNLTNDNFLFNGFNSLKMS